MIEEAGKAERKTRAKKRRQEHKEGGRICREELLELRRGDRSIREEPGTVQEHYSMLYLKSGVLHQ
jgi:hypothetical protein